MNIQYMSDIHLEFGELPVPNTDNFIALGDILVLAGDITVGHRHNNWIVECARVFPNVIYINGNHEYYGKNFYKLQNEQILFFSEFDNIHFLNNDCVELNGINFIGSTLWSKADSYLNHVMNDFRRITYDKNGYRKFNTKDAYFEHIKAVDFISKNIRSDIKNIVITHHAPSFKSQGARQKDLIGTGYCTDILDKFNNIDLWIHGHTHHCIDYVENGIHVVSNQRGYEGHELCSGFDINKVIEV